MTLVREGPAAAWRELMQHLGNLQEMLFGQIRSWVQNTIVTQAVMRIASMLNPAGSVIQAIIAIYNTIMFFVERMRQIGAVVESVVNSMSAIAAGSIGPAANAVEQTMARLVPVVIRFLARLIGLGGISGHIQATMRRIQQPINNAIDRLIDWIVAQARRLGRGIMQAGVPQDPGQRLEAGLTAAVAIINRISGNRIDAAVIRPLLSAIRIRYQFQSLDVEARDGRWHVVGQINPTNSKPTGRNTPQTTGTGTAASGSPTLVPIGSWIKNLQNNSYERVSAQGVLRRNRETGEERVATFMTDKSEGGTNTLSYTGEGTQWERSNFNHSSNYVMPLGSSANFV
jgi:hypothetical protein